MSAPTGIVVSEELTSAFSDAVASQDIRFIKVSIRNESLVPDGQTAPSGTLEEDLDILGGLLEDNVPAYVLVRLDDSPSQWLAIYYVPDSAKVRDKMLYAATRTTLTKSLGSAHFSDSLFATDKNDISAEAYVKHRQHLAAPKPMSAREKEIEAVKAAEREAGGLQYEGSQARRSHVKSDVGLKWTEDVENAVRDLALGNSSSLVVVSIKPSSETLELQSVTKCSADKLASIIPSSDPSFAFFAWQRDSISPPRRDLIFIYSCPSCSPVKDRMVYSLGSNDVFRNANGILSSSGGIPAFTTRRVETSDPTELNEGFLTSWLDSNDLTSTNSAEAPVHNTEKKPFARPKGPGRKR
ncbi:uncharacterized protein FIBRA_04143 [Fibroporia radiculosa]|uniref:ADF-H domain-containing protein n=1 Tax=Fibroporia radiculosa TaxID=599839 RepID=J4HWD4_9APHY|nr:uncharacterized protein FIBRA_04143 [Fibroporia radiculosa]CCM02067.1 predicted protein [Fibroporia radiculosa]